MFFLCNSKGHYGNSRQFSVSLGQNNILTQSKYEYCYCQHYVFEVNWTCIQISPCYLKMNSLKVKIRFEGEKK